MGEAPHTAGGALSNGKLKLATATAADVASGKTFYAGDKTIKTGTKKINNIVYKTVSFPNQAAGWNGNISRALSYSELGLKEKPTLLYGFEGSGIGGGGGARSIALTSVNYTNTSATFVAKYSNSGGWGGATLKVWIVY